MGDWGSVVPRLRRGGSWRIRFSSGHHGRVAAQALGPSWTRRWTPSSRVCRRPKIGRCSHPESSCEELNHPRTSSRPQRQSVPSTRSSRPIWCLFRISHRSVRMARDCCISSQISSGPTCPTILAAEGTAWTTPFEFWPRAPRSCCWKWHLLGSWTTTEQRRRSDAFRAVQAVVPEGRAGSRSFWGRWQHVELRARRAVGDSVRDAVAYKEWWNENLYRPAILYITRIKSAATAVEDGTAHPVLERSV